MPTSMDNIVGQSAPVSIIVPDSIPLALPLVTLTDDLSQSQVIPLFASWSKSVTLVCNSSSQFPWLSPTLYAFTYI